MELIDDLIKVLERVRDCNQAYESLKAISENIFFDEDSFQRCYGNDPEARRKIGSYLKKELKKVKKIIEKV